MLKPLKKSNEGFTIIEVMIVLAIAGLILLVVFLAVPALQRSSRNTQRKSDANHLMSLITEYESNNNGAAPTTVATGSAPATPVAGTLYLGSEKFAILTPPTSITVYSASTAAPTTDTPVLMSNAMCNGNVPQAGTSSRQIVLWYYIESSTTPTQCVQS